MTTASPGPAAIDGSKTLIRAASGRWAGEQFMKAMAENREFGASVLRTADTLRKDEWKHFDEALIEEYTIRLRIVADLMMLGLTTDVPNSLGKTVYEYETAADMNPAETTLSGMAMTEGDRQEFTLSQIPLPITHKDFFIHLRTLVASRTRGEALDTMQMRTAGRLIAEQVEKMVFQGLPNTFGGLSVYGLTTHPNRNTRAHGTNGLWSSFPTKTGENILTDVNNLISDAEGDRCFGPYHLYIPKQYSTVLNNDFKANSDKTIRQRLLEIDGLEAIRTADQMPDNEVVLVQMTRDVIELVVGEPLQTVQWDIQGGMQVNFKGLTIQVPLIRADDAGRSGVQHMSGT